jgi:predicted Zn-dependent peptidase
MKKLVVLVAVLAIVAPVFAQVDRTKAPKPAPAREIKIGEYQTFTLKNGLQVFVVENHKLPRIQFTLQLKNDPILEGPKVGYVEMAGDLLGTGTASRSKAQLDEAVDFIGATLNTSWNGVFASSLTKHRDKLLELMTDVLYNPSFSQAEMDKLKTQMLSGIAAEKDDPSAIAGNVRSVLVYGKNHTYGEISTEKTVEAITLDDCKNYFNTYFKPGNAYLAIVGDIDLKTAKAAAEKYFDKWTPGEVKNPTYAVPQAPAKTYVALVDRPNSVQSVINVAYPVDLKSGSADVIKARVMNQILGVGFSARLMQNLREKHGFTYGAASSLNPDFLIGNFNASASVRNEVTDSSIFEFMSELKRIVNEPVTDVELAAAKAFISGQFGRSLENPQTIASFAINTAKYKLPKDYYANYLKNVDATTTADVQAMAKKYIKPDNATIVVVGKGADIADKLKPFGEVKYFDMYGEPYTPAKASALPAGLTAEKVMGNYIEAIGGAKKVQELKTLKVTMKGSIQGQELQMTNVMKAPFASVVDVTMGGMSVQKAVSDGKDFAMTAMGQKAPLDDKDKEAQIFGGAVVKEAVYQTMGATATLRGIESVDGKEAYVVDFVLPKGTKVSEYYDRESGLKVQSVQMVKSPQGEAPAATRFSDYKDVKGYKFPHTFSQAMGPMTLKFEVLAIEVNPTVDDAVFKVQ